MTVSLGVTTDALAVDVAGTAVVITGMTGLVMTVDVCTPGAIDWPGITGRKEPVWATGDWFGNMVKVIICRVGTPVFGRSVRCTTRGARRTLRITCFLCRRGIRISLCCF